MTGPDTLTYAYDGLGRRVSVSKNGQTTTTLYDGWNPIQLQQGATIIENRLTGLGLDETYARTRGGITESYLTDALGSTVELRESAQAQTTQYTYEPYGGTTQSAPSTNLAKYTGREQDSADLYYYRSRYYKPSLGPFLSEDPIGLAGGLNSYAYVLNNPLRWTDPTGLDVFLCRRPADLPFPLNQFDHFWVKTDTLEAGMGGMRGVVPGQNGNFDRPYDPTQTVDHSGQSKASNASCEEQRNVDEQCVNDLIQPGQPTDSWNPYNQCQSFAYGAINRCRTGPQIPPSR